MHGDNVRKMVERTLLWTLGAVRPLKIPELIEAIAVEEEQTLLDEYAKVDEPTILRWCSCLVRKTSSGENVELAQFTVKEFLRKMDPREMPQLSRFAHLGRMADVELDQICLCYLNYDDFVQARLEDRFWHSRNLFWNYAALHIACLIPRDLRTQEKLLNCVSKIPFRRSTLSRHCIMQPL